MRVEKAGVRADEFEFPGVELLHAEVGKIFYLHVFSRHDFGEIKADFSSAHAPRLCALGEMFDFRRVKQGFCGHAPPQDAQSANFASAFYDNRFQSRTDCRARRRVTTTAATEDHHVEIKFFHGLSMDPPRTFLKETFGEKNRRRKNPPAVTVQFLVM